MVELIQNQPRWDDGADDPPKILQGSLPGRFEYRYAPSIPAQVPDTRDRSDPSYISYFHNELCPDIAKNGILTPLVLAIMNGAEVLLDGETRRRAALEVGSKKKIPVLILEGPIDPTDLDILRYRLNKKRRSFSPMEETRFLFNTMKAKGWTQARLCRELSLIPGTVSRYFKVNEKLSDKLHARLGDGPGMLSWRGAYAICELPADQQEHWADKLINDLMCIEDVEKAVRGGKKSRPKKLVYRQKHIQVVIQSEDQNAAIGELTALIENLRRKKPPPAA